MKKRLLSILLTACLLVGLLPTVALAAGTDEPAHTHCICGGNTDVGKHTSHPDVTYQQWNGTSAIDYGDDNIAYVYLTNDVTIQSNLEIKDGKTLYLCLNGKTFASNGINKIVVKENSRFILCDCAGGGTIDGADSGWGGTGIYLYNSTMDMYGGKITGGYANGNGGGGAIALDDVNCVFNMYGGEISGNKAKVNGGAIFLNGTSKSKKSGTVNLYGGTISKNSAANGGAIYAVYCGSVNIYGGTISNNKASKFGGAILLNFDGQMTMSGGTITGNEASTWDGGAISLYNSTFTFSDGTITGNKAVDGGAINLDYYSQMTMTGGTISNNTATEKGGAVYMYGENSTFNFSGGTITGNEAVNGGAIYLEPDKIFGDSAQCTLNMSGGEISGNKATGNGGAVYFYEAGDSSEQGILNISGNPVVKDNTVSGKANNIYLKSGKNLSLSIDHMMTDGASVGITTESTDYPVVFSNVFFPDYTSYFFADDPDAYVKQNNLSRLVLAKRTHTHNWSTEWTTDDTHHWHECTAAGCSVINNAYKSGYAEHTYDQEIATADYKASDATCTAKATYYKSCVCGAKGTETFEYGEVDASNHTFGDWIDEVPATCKTTGTKGHKDCTSCNKHFNADGNEITDLTIPVDPANHVGTPGNWQTDSDKHWKAYSCCSATVEEGTHTYDQEIANADYKASDATCTAKATYYKSCICGAKGTETFESGEVDASNHTFGEWINEVPATCVTKGTMSHKDCTGCGKHFDASGNEITDLTIPFDSANHEGAPGDWQTDPDKHWKAYSCCGATVEEGTHDYDGDTDTDCNTCGYTRTIESAHTHCVCGGNTAVGDHTSHTDVTWTGVSSLGEITGTGSYYLTDDILMSSNLNITGTVNLCLNGHQIYTQSGVPYGTVKIQTGAALNVCDCSEDKSGLITTCRGSYAIENSGTLNLYSGSVERYNTGGAAVKVNAGAVFNMYGGKIGGTDKAILAYGTVNVSGGTVSAMREAMEVYAGSEVTVSGNAALSVTGSGYSTIAVYGGVVNIRGGKVTNNSGSAVYAPSGESTLNISGGEISTSSSAKKDTIRLVSDSVEVTVTGGSITNGYPSPATSGNSIYGWAIGVYKVKSLTISGAPVINRIYLAENRSITVGEDGLTYETPIEIHCAKYPAPVTGANDTDYSSKFTPKSSFYEIINAKDNVVLFTKAATVTYTDGVDGEEIFTDQTHNTYLGQPTPAFNGTPQRTGYTFAGWYTDTGYTTEYNFSTPVTGNLTLYAKWTVNQYTITFDTDGGSAVDAITQDYGTAITAPENPTKTGYTFNGWDTTIPNTMPAEDMTIKAKWTVNQYTITFDTDGGSEVASITQDYGTAVTPPQDPTKTGYTFNGWDKAIPDTMPAENLTIAAKWTKNRSGGSVSTYAITVESAKNGDVTSSHKTAAKGTTVTLTVEPDKGYTLETITVTDKNGDEIELTNKGDGKYTFKMPTSKVYVEATFMEDNSMLNFFVDVFPGDYYYDAVLWAAKNGITGGVDDPHFAPNATCTRAQAVTFLWRVAGSPAPKSSEMPFKDVVKGSYYYDAVLWAVENGITKGTSDTTFSPDADCTRAQIVTFLWRSQASPAAGTVNPFTDVAADAYYNSAVLWAVENGITTGTTATTFSPNNDCTRAQIVTFLWRALAE